MNGPCSSLISGGASCFTRKRMVFRYPAPRIANAAKCHDSSACLLLSFAGKSLEPAIEGARLLENPCASALFPLVFWLFLHWVGACHCRTFLSPAYLHASCHHIARRALANPSFMLEVISPTYNLPEEKSAQVCWPRLPPYAILEAVTRHCVVPSFAKDSLHSFSETQTCRSRILLYTSR